MIANDANDILVIAGKAVKLEVGLEAASMFTLQTEVYDV